MVHLFRITMAKISGKGERDMEKQAFAKALVSLSDTVARLLFALMDKSNVLELLSGKLSLTIEREAARASGWSRNELLLKLLIRLNQAVHNEKLSYITKEDFVQNTNFIVQQAIEELSKSDKEFQGETLLDLLVYEGEKIETIRREGEGIQETLCPDAQSIAIYVQRLLEPTGKTLPAFSAQRLREKLLPFALYVVFLWNEQLTSEETEARIQSFLRYWQEKKGIYDHLQKKMSEHTYAIELEERLLEQKTSNMKVLQRQLDQIAEERENIKAALMNRIPHDIQKFEGIFGGKAKVVWNRMVELAERREEEKDDAQEEEGLLRSLWHRIDTSISDAQMERETKRLAAKLVEEMVAMKKDIIRLPVYYMDRIKQIHDCDGKIQEIRRWRYQLEQEVEKHREKIQHHKVHRSTLEQQMKQWEKELFL
ncbi:hypothetical protein SAMN04489735_1004155 [Aneurinibacillus thermoaerophilus]|uniref:Uncharacterized protein n=2 Tax=Aneurinibacillus thermoaerophilus TaxID=143495 RepID=A0A1G7XT82_ANETH|nr:hypothetical protein [Aneurinibacillus sp. XH2]AMA73718.1 hypothetical protein ACH33_13175 [Aneurinibacillus sp. XH2]SDG86930.1 hypothetical protein SAMN04489735_1004155 [Aneurinibacillus thermoaerophilus]